MNKIFLSGRLASEPKVRFTSSGKVACQFILACEREYTNQAGEKITDFIPVVLWGNTAEVAGNNLVKGKKISVEGRLQTRSYFDKEDKKRWVTELAGRRFEYMYDNPAAKKEKQSDNIETPFADLPVPEGFAMEFADEDFNYD